MIRRGADFFLLDVRSPAEYQQVRLPGSNLIPLGTLRGRIDELPKDKEIITYCQVSLRGYEAALILKGAGLQQVRVLDGGLMMWPFEKDSQPTGGQCDSGSDFRPGTVQETGVQLGHQ
jgi:rhodanese-related sulfurtransferase